MEYHHFKQENLSFVLDIIEKNDYLTSIDLIDAYFSFSINNELKKYLCFSWNFDNGDFDSETNISLKSENEIVWWVVNLKFVNGKLIRPNSIDCWIETDASLEGWGSKFNKNLTGGRWNDDRSHHIN